MSFNIIIRNDDGTDEILDPSKASKAQLAKWINQAPDNNNRQVRKQMLHGFTYGAGTQSLIQLSSSTQPESSSKT